MSSGFERLKAITTSVYERDDDLKLVVDWRGVGRSVVVNTPEERDVFELVDMTLASKALMIDRRDVDLVEITMDTASDLGASVLKVPVFDLYSSWYAASFRAINPTQVQVAERHTIVNPLDRFEIDYAFADVTSRVGVGGMIDQLSAMRAASNGPGALNDPNIPELFQLLVIL